jgi:hypothetical protein
MARWLVPLFLLMACIDSTEDDLAGVLVRVDVVTVDDPCNLPRFTGDAGVQYFGERPSGQLVFTMSQQAQFGPLLDGGTLESVQRQVIPSPDAGRANVGEGTGCEGSFSRWERTDGGLLLKQELPGVDSCEAGPRWLPFFGCTVTREFRFTEVGTCQLRCVQLSSKGEVDCGC